MRCSLILVVLVTVCGVVTAAQGFTYKLGRPPTDDELRRPGAAVAPDGDGLPSGSGNAEQGALLFVARGCGVCHGPTGEEGPGPHLAGPHRGGVRGTSNYDALYERGNWQGRGIRNFMFAPQIWSWINKAMPLNQGGFLTVNEVYSLTAYLLYRNGVIQEADVMDAQSLPQVQMPNRGAYAYTPDHPALSEWEPGMPRTRAR